MKFNFAVIYVSFCSHAITYLVCSSTAASLIGTVELTVMKGLAIFNHTIHQLVLEKK